MGQGQSLPKVVNGKNEVYILLLSLSPASLCKMLFIKFQETGMNCKLVWSVQTQSSQIGQPDSISGRRLKSSSNLRREVMRHLVASVVQ